MTRWGIVIDLLKCVGCYACVISCKQEHFLPPGVFWNSIIISESGNYPMVRKHILPVMCNHCREAPCVKVCPSGATTRREDGIVLVDYDKCIGCRYCLVACPYQQRTFYANNARIYFPDQGLTQYEALGRQIYPHETGTVMKCNFCVERIDEGIRKNLKPGIDREATPACVITCPAKARYFGDLDDPFSEVSVLIKTRKGHQLRPEYGTDPSVYYLEY